MKHNVLLVLPFFPYPLTSGGHQAVYTAMQALNTIANVSIVYLEGYRDKSSEYRKQMLSIPENSNIKVHPFIIPQSSIGFKDKFKLVFELLYKKLFKPTPDEIIKNNEITCRYSNTYLEYINHIIKVDNIDVVQMEMATTMPLILALPKNVKTIFVEHEIRHVVMELKSEHYGNNLYCNIFTQMSKIKEIGLLNLYDKVVTLSNIDSNKLIQDGVKKSKIFTSYAIVEEANKIDSNEIATQILTFIGPESHTPNVMGLMWFLENCWNKLLEKNLGFELQVVGIWSHKTTKKITGKYRNVRFRGFVKDLSDAYIGTTVIVPINTGSGIRMKIVEAMARKVPFISTTIGAEGLPVTNEHDCIIADEPDDFVDGIIRLQELGYRKRLVNNAFKLYQNNFTFNSLINNRKNLLMDIFTEVLAI